MNYIGLNLVLWLLILVISMVIGMVTTYIQPACAVQDNWTLHTVSIHPGQSGMNNINIGVAYNVTDNIRIGAVHNSYEKVSLYVVNITTINDNWRIGTGVASGYRSEFWSSSPVIPVISVEYDITDNLSVLWFGTAINLEVKF